MFQSKIVIVVNISLLTKTFSTGYAEKIPIKVDTRISDAKKNKAYEKISKTS